MKSKELLPNEDEGFASYWKRVSDAIGGMDDYDKARFFWDAGRHIEKLVWSRAIDGLPARTVSE